MPEHAKRLAVLFVMWFVPLTALDLGITWYGEHYVSSPDRRCCHELNPFTDFSSIPAYVGPEVVALIVGVAMVGTGGWWKVRALAKIGSRTADLRDLPFNTFFRRYSEAGGWIPLILIIFPLVIAMGRIYPVVNNLMYLVIDWGFNSLFGRVTFMVAPLVCGITVFPMFYLIRRSTLVD